MSYHCGCEISYLLTLLTSWRSISILDTCYMLIYMLVVKPQYCTVFIEMQDTTSIQWTWKLQKQLFHSIENLKVSDDFQSHTLLIDVSHDDCEKMYWADVEVFCVVCIDIYICASRVLLHTSNNLPLFYQKKIVMCSHWQMEHTVSISVIVFTIATSLSSFVIPLIISVKNILLAG